MYKVGDSIKKLRKGSGETQAQLGEAIGVNGVSVMRYEQGSRKPTLEMLQKIASHYCIDCNYFLDTNNENDILRHLSPAIMQLRRELGTGWTMILRRDMELIRTIPFEQNGCHDEHSILIFCNEDSQYWTFDIKRLLDKITVFPAYEDVDSGYVTPPACGFDSFQQLQRVLSIMEQKLYSFDPETDSLDNGGLVWGAKHWLDIYERASNLVIPANGFPDFAKAIEGARVKHGLKSTQETAQAILTNILRELSDDQIELLLNTAKTMSQQNQRKQNSTENKI